MAITTKRQLLVRRVVVALACGLCITAVAGTHAKVRVGGEPVQRAAVEEGQELLSQPVSTLVMLAPFALLGVAAPLFVLKGPATTRWFVVGLEGLMLAALYFNGFNGAEHAMRERKWTAAALSVGLLPFIGGALVLGSLLAVVMLKALIGNATRAAGTGDHDGA